MSLSLSLSLSLIRYDPKLKRVTEIARDHNANYMTAISVLNDDVFLGAENSFNLFTVRKNADAASDEDRTRLDVVGECTLLLLLLSLSLFFLSLPLLSLSS